MYPTEAVRFICNEIFQRVCAVVVLSGLMVVALINPHFAARLMPMIGDKFKEIGS